jgi:hypothetical protein
MGTVIHVGRKVPKGFVELPGSVHLGKGMWIFKIKREDERLSSSDALQLRPYTRKNRRN